MNLFYILSLCCSTYIVNNCSNEQEHQLQRLVQRSQWKAVWVRIMFQRFLLQLDHHWLFLLINRSWNTSKSQTSAPSSQPSQKLPLFSSTSGSQFLYSQFETQDSQLIDLPSSQQAFSSNRAAQSTENVWLCAFAYSKFSRICFQSEPKQRFSGFRSTLKRNSSSSNDVPSKRSSFDLPKPDDRLVP
jgi:hypothetical protein